MHLASSLLAEQSLLTLQPTNQHHARYSLSLVVCFAAAVRAGPHAGVPALRSCSARRDVGAQHMAWTLLRDRNGCFEGTPAQ